MKLWILLVGVVLSISNSCGQRDQQNSSTTMDTKSSAIYELAVRQVKPGMLADFEAARTNFIAKLQQEQGVDQDREFQSFYALPAPDSTEVFIGMTRYATMETVQNVSGKLMSSAEAGAFFSTLDFKAYAMIQPVEGPTFNLSTLAKKEGQVLEIAVRNRHEGKEDAFNISRKAFVDYLSAQPGVLESYEFKVLASLPGVDTQNMSVGMTVYESQEAFMKIAGAIMQEEVTQAYFGTFEVVAAQYAVSIK